MDGALLLLLCVVSFVIGFLSVAVYVSWQQAQQLLEVWHTRAPHWPHVGCQKMLESWTSRSRPPSAMKATPKLAQVDEINEQLKKLMDLGMRDYFEKWYHQHITMDPVCTQEAQEILVHVLSQVAIKSRQVDYLTYLVETIMEDFLDHFKRYKHACGRSQCVGGWAEGDSGTVGGGGGLGVAKVTNSSRLKLIEEAFFEADTPDNPWKAICLYPEAKRVYLRRVTEVLLYLLLPEADFSNPLLHVLLTDVCAWQVLASLLQTIIDPDNFNKTVISIGKDSFLTPETFMAAMQEGSTELELRAFQMWITGEISSLRKTGVTDSDQEKFNTYGNLKATADQIMQGEVKEQTPPSDHSSLLSFKVTIPTFNISHEGSNKHCVFSLDVRCRHSHASIEEHWVTQRRYRDFQDMDLTLRNQVENFPFILTLPSLPTFNKLDPQRLEVRRQSLERYIQVVSGDQFLREHPQVMSQVILFLTEGEFTRNTSDLQRKMDSILKPLSSMKRSAVAITKKASFATTPSLSGAVSNSSLSSSSPKPSPSSTRKSTDNKSTTGDDDEDSLPVDMLIDLLEEVFDMSDKKWLRRQLPVLLRQLVGGKISRKVVQTADWLTSSQQVAHYLHVTMEMMWPGGFPAESRGSPPSDVRARRSLLARSKMIGSIPDELKRLIGNDSTGRGMARLWRMFQSESLNCCLALVLLEGLLDALFPARNVRETFKVLRIEISKSHY